MKYIDIHTHGAFGVDFNNSCYNEIKELSRLYFSRGIVAFCPTFIGDSSENLQERFEIFSKLKSNYSKNESYIIGAHLEGTFINPYRAGIQDPSVFLKPTIDNFKNLVGEFEHFIKIVTLAPELDENLELTKYLKSKNIKVHCGHTLSDSTMGLCATTHHFNAMPAISHRGESIALDSMYDNDIYCEIIADGVHVSDNLLKTFFKIKNENKVILVSDSLCVAHHNKEMEFCSKEIFPNGRDKDNNLAGSVMLLDEIVKRLVESQFISTSTANQYAFLNPLNHLCLDDNEKKIIRSLT